MKKQSFIDALWEKHKHEVGGFSAIGPSGFKAAIEEATATRDNAIKDLVEASELINETFSPARDGMDYEVLPVGVRSLRQALAKVKAVT